MTEKKPKPWELKPILPAVVFYRYSDFRVSAGLDEYDCPVGPSTTKIQLETYRVTKLTPTGVWLQNIDRFVSTKTGKRFACPTVEEARISFTARKIRQIAILSTQISHAKQALTLLEKETLTS